MWTPCQEVCIQKKKTRPCSFTETCPLVTLASGVRQCVLHKTYKKKSALMSMVSRDSTFAAGTRTYLLLFYVGSVGLWTCFTRLGLASVSLVTNIVQVWNVCTRAWLVFREYRTYGLNAAVKTNPSELLYYRVDCSFMNTLLFLFRFSGGFIIFLDDQLLGLRSREQKEHDIFPVLCSEWSVAADSRDAVLIEEY